MISFASTAAPSSSTPTTPAPTCRAFRDAGDGADRQQAHLQNQMENGVGSDLQAQQRSVTRHHGEEIDTNVNKLARQDLREHRRVHLQRPQLGQQVAAHDQLRLRHGRIG
ncbi:hypothetical protein [Aeromicrobium sp. UC242_57]|uniref:hypothetical protein n=1 Tax=Aeromicrobium sp. UC242_57 TaxID=3374624 RepID=UPI0037A1A2CD